MSSKFLSFLVLVTCYLFLVSLSFAHAPTTIIINKDSYKPSEVTIHQGDEVVFQNNDIKAHWPASNLHPTHGIYPEFDPKQAIEPKKSWKFKFERAGSFRFHDHLNPHITGTINVEKEILSTAKLDLKINLDSSFSKNSPVKAYLERVYYFIFPKKLPGKLQGFDAHQTSLKEDELKYWLIIIGGKQYMDKLVVDTEGGSKIDCHQEAHKVGRMAYKLYGSSTFQQINYGCHSGYLHGAMESFIAKINDPKVLTERVENLCNKFHTEFSKFECLHGIGHGFTAYLDYDIPETLKMCSELSTPYAQRSCFGGVFMENIMAAEGKGALAGHVTKWISSDPHFPCNKVDKAELIQFECYQMQTSRMLHLFNYSYAPIAQECLRAPPAMVSVCFRSLGRDIAGQTLRDPDKIIQNCQFSPPQYYQECLTGGLNVIVDFWGETIKDQPQNFCNRLTSPSDKQACFRVLGERLKNVFGSDKAKIESLCQYADPLYLNACLEGNTSIDTETKKLGLFPKIIESITKFLQKEKKTIGKEDFLKLSQPAQLKELKALTETWGPPFSWEFIKKTYTNISPSSGNAHDLAHYLGELIYDTQGFSGLSICGVEFAYGCYHGFLDKAFLTGLSNLPLAERACVNLGPVNSGPFASCIHGIGHGLASFHQFKDLDSSLADCDKLISGSSFCQDGVFMEFERSAIESFYSRENPISPCDKLDPRFASSCGRNQSIVMLRRLKMPFLEVVNICNGVSDPNFRLACFDSLGFHLVYLNNGDPKKITNSCMQSDLEEFQEHCLTASAGELIFQNIPGWQKNSFEICSNLSEAKKTKCEDYLKKLISDYHRV